MIAYRRWSLIGLAFSCLLMSAAWACQVPVFRYALERWPADRYEVVVIHEDPLEKSDHKQLKTLGGLDHDSPMRGNFELRTVSVDELKDKTLLRLWAQHKPPGPLMVVLYPRNAREVPDRIVAAVPLREQNLGSLADSPVRREVAKRLLDGDSAVWIFVPSGHADQDSVALRTLRDQVARNEKELKLPPPDELEEDEFFLEQSTIELRLSFSIVTLDRDDPQEKYLLELLLESEPDLKTLDQPMAFPVLGRGRVLYGLVGKGIFADTIGTASSFIVGPCSCQVKEQNPGFDLLMSVDWDQKVGVTAVADEKSKSAEPVLLTIPPGRAKK